MKRILFALIAILGFVSCEESVGVDTKQTLTLAVDNAEIYANGKQTATFTVKDSLGAVVNDATIYYADTNEAIDGYTFTTKYAGEYTFYAKRDNVKSNEIKVVALEVTEDTKVVTLTATYPEGGPVVGQIVSFVVDCNGEDVTAESVIFSAADDSVIEDAMFTSDKAGDFVFYASYDDIKSNNVTLTFVEGDSSDDTDNSGDNDDSDNNDDSGDNGEDSDNNDDSEQPAGELILSVAPTTIYADGEEKAVFSLKDGEQEIADFEVYNAADDSKLAGKEFSTTEPAVYEFYAMCEQGKSNTVKVTARMKIVEEQQPVVLSASKDTLKANGVDTIVFSVEQGGANISNSAAIYINDGKLNGNKFATIQHGTYVAYAEYNGVKSNEITITAEEVTATGTSIVFAEGVTISSGWYDVNKKGAGDNGDINMCWAAASSNMIQWFQDRYVAAGNKLPSTAINGPGTKVYGNFAPYELALMEVYHDEWDNSKGGHPEEAIPWYFEGKLYQGELATVGSQAYPLTKGGYWGSTWSTVLPHIYHDYTHVVAPGIEYPNMYTCLYNNYYLWGNGSSLEGNERLAYFSNLVVEAFERGMASLTISLSDNIASLHHAVTLWGYEIDNATGLLTRVWITDSDDIASEPKQQLLNEYSVSIGSGKSHIQLSGNTRYGKAWIVSIHPFSGYKK